MPFEKGNNLGKGRPQGKPNKTTQEIREMFQILLEDNISNLQDDLQNLEPKDRIKILLDLAKLVLPTKIETSTSQEKQEPRVIVCDSESTKQGFLALRKMFEDEAEELNKI